MVAFVGAFAVMKTYPIKKVAILKSHCLAVDVKLTSMVGSGGCSGLTLIFDKGGETNEVVGDRVFFDNL